MMDVHELPCGCTYTYDGPHYRQHGGVEHGYHTVSYATTFHRRCSTHAPKARKRKVKPPTRMGAKLATLTYNGGQAQAYAENVGRDWKEVDPAPDPADFGAPEAPSFVVGESTPEELDAYDAAFTEWLFSQGRQAYLDALHRWAARRRQFEYRKAHRAEIIAEAAA